MSDERQNEIDAAELRRLLDEERNKRIAACNAEIEATLRRYRCALVPVVVLRGGEQSARIEIVAE